MLHSWHTWSVEYLAEPWFKIPCCLTERISEREVLGQSGCHSWKVLRQFGELHSTSTTVVLYLRYVAMNWIRNWKLHPPQNRVKIMTVNFNEAAEDSRQDHHSGARDFVFWNLPQVREILWYHTVPIYFSGPAQESKCPNCYIQESHPKVPHISWHPAVQKVSLISINTNYLQPLHHMLLRGQFQGR